MTSKRGRHCSLCRQRYGSGFRDNVAASDVLRARRMLVERSGSDSDASSCGIRQGLGLFLDDLAKQRERQGNQHLPLDVCAFCTQDTLADDARPSVFHTSHSHHHPSRNQHSASRSSRTSSLVIQHKSAKTPRPPSARGGLVPPEPSSPFPDSLGSTSPPPPRPSYRLLTNDTTRVLRIESPRGGALAVGGAESTTLMASGVVRDLRLQAKQQTAAIFSAKQDDALRRRATVQQPTALHESSGAATTLTKRNIVHAIRARGAADSLYTGVVLTSHAGPTDAKKPSAGFRVRTHKTGRHFKTELFLPPV